MIRIFRISCPTCGCVFGKVRTGKILGFTCNNCGANWILTNPDEISEKQISEDSEDENGEEV